MNLGKSLFQARKKSGLSQEEVAEQIGVSRQTISKWETHETLPDIHQSKKLSLLYNMTLDELIDFDVDVKEIEEIIERTTEEIEGKVNWTNAWGKKYPILLNYQTEVDSSNYANRMNTMLDELKQENQLSEVDALLVLKDILFNVYNERKEITNHKKSQFLKTVSLKIDCFFTKIVFVHD